MTTTAKRCPHLPAGVSVLPNGLLGRSRVNIGIAASDIAPGDVAKLDDAAVRTGPDRSVASSVSKPCGVGTASMVAA
jgi:hypothetical protein